MTRHYINLTNGLEDLPISEPFAFTRLRSTTIEKCNWSALFCEDVGADLYMHLALGVRCVVHDRGTRRQWSKTLSFGVPLIRYVLCRRWGVQAPTAPALTASDPDYAEIYYLLIDRAEGDRGAARRTIDYYGRYTRGVLRLDVDGGSTERDGDYDFYKNIARGLYV